MLHNIELGGLSSTGLGWVWIVVCCFCDQVFHVARRNTGWAGQKVLLNSSSVFVTIWKCADYNFGSGVTEPVTPLFADGRLFAIRVDFVEKVEKPNLGRFANTKFYSKAR